VKVLIHVDLIHHRFKFLGQVSSFRADSINAFIVTPPCEGVKWKETKAKSKSLFKHQEP
jgi:hypothetical protein